MCVNVRVEELTVVLCTCRDEKVRKLEQQLRNAYGSLGRAALRASGGALRDGVEGSVRISRIGLAATQAPVAQSLDEAIEVKQQRRALLVEQLTCSTTVPNTDVEAF